MTDKNTQLPSEKTTGPGPVRSTLMRLSKPAGSKEFIALVAITFCFVLAAIAWVGSAKVDHVVTINGRIESFGDIRVLSSPRGGMAEFANISVGQKVEKGDRLLIIKNKQLDLEYENLQQDVDILAAEVARLEAEMLDEEPSFPDDLRKRRPELISDQEKLYTLNMLAKNAKLQKIEEEAAKKMATWDGYAEQTIALEESYREIEENSRAAIILPPEWNISHSQWQSLSKARKLSFLQKRLKEARVRENRALAELSEARLSRESFEREFEAEIAETLSGKRSRHAALKRELGELKATRNNLVITAPLTGIIDHIFVAGEGRFVEANMPLVAIQPVAEEINIAGFIDEIRLESVALGQEVTIHLFTPKRNKHIRLDGTIQHITARPIFHDENLSPVYKLSIQASKQLDRGERSSYVQEFSPDMNVEIKINNGTRPMLQAILDVFKGYRSPAGKNLLNYQLAQDNG